MKAIIFQYDWTIETNEVDKQKALDRLQEVGATHVNVLTFGIISAQIEEEHIPFLDQYGRVEVKPLKQIR